MRKTFFSRLDKNLHDRLRLHAAIRETTMNSMVTQALEAYLDAIEKTDI